ncbi:MAG TPA: DNA topoisomerase IB [Candidatus Dormibacteraeota bacterium]
MDDARAAARDAGLRYTSDQMPGIRRRRAGRGFAYVNADDRPVRDAATLRRIKRLAVPPAWTDVWICAQPNGHLQATGRDARGRKQYRYHDRWREVRDEAKYERLVPFGRALPKIRARVRRDLELPGTPRDKVLAAVVRLLDRTLVRVGNEEYARENDSYGATTLREEHVDVEGSRLRLRFRGKGGREHVVGLRDRRLARLVKQLEELPGQELFQYVDDDGQVRPVTSDDINDYLRDITGDDFTAKDFRTWAGTVLGLYALTRAEPPSSAGQARRELSGAIKWVAGLLGNTPAVCRKCYVDGAVIQAYLDGKLKPAPDRELDEMLSEVEAGLRPEERAVLRFLD